MTFWNCQNQLFIYINNHLSYCNTLLLAHKTLFIFFAKKNNFNRLNFKLIETFQSAKSVLRVSYKFAQKLRVNTIQRAHSIQSDYCHYAKDISVCHEQ